jgi:L-seryl-tRNA(Ser) seleniumtransferase
VDKLVYSVLEATLEAFRHETVIEEIPVLRMLAMSYGEINQKAYRFLHALKEVCGEESKITFEAGTGNSVIGGGSAPAAQPQTILISLKHSKMSASKLEQALRNATPPVVARIIDDRVLLDLRTVADSEEPELLEILSGLAKV